MEEVGSTMGNAHFRSSNHTPTVIIYQVKPHEVLKCWSEVIVKQRHVIYVGAVNF